MAVKRYQDFIVWQKSMELVIDVYRLVRLLPDYEKYALGDQMRRAAVSIPSNIAEGNSRFSNKDFKHFLFISRGSVSELETQLNICTHLNYINEVDTEKSRNLCIEVGRLLNALINSMK